MPKNRKKTYSDHQREAPQRPAKKKPAPRPEVTRDTVKERAFSPALAER
jgi:hypothetical protein